MTAMSGLKTLAFEMPRREQSQGGRKFDRRWGRRLCNRRSRFGRRRRRDERSQFVLERFQSRIVLLAHRGQFLLQPRHLRLRIAERLVSGRRLGQDGLRYAPDNSEHHRYRPQPDCPHEFDDTSYRWRIRHAHVTLLR